ncbi:5-formyltetrahydrofolate cyclo-ligase [Glycomyces xiaoerkulensis]|uniref:5-formyltetrahydrofolate cyclo-ligase n=1 Tax=Glycomyces xiaoerkulensis TaxID=2038139 RepID=UPI000C25D8D4|nr:5-formyltetrahydrofolate cyclo-ligase [Glycomyces xiaoerkulensis]
MAIDKHIVRTKLLSSRKALPAADRASADRATWIALRGYLDETLTAGATVAAYRPFGAEPGATLQPELPERLAETYRVLLPVTLADNDLDWVVVGTEVPQSSSDPARPRTALSGPKGTEKVAATRGPAAIGRAEVVIVPALGVSHSGLRLGRGGGSYDRALTRLRPGTPVVGLLRDGEFGVAVPAEDHDRPVTAIVTPSGGYATLE